MSDNWIILIPEDPQLVPEAEQQRRALERFAGIVPHADEVELKVTEKVTFYDCGGNFEHIFCPACRSEIPVSWWQDRMREDAIDGYRLLTYQMPCCAENATLHELIYEWPQGFARFALEAMNPNVGKLDERTVQELETIIGTKLRVIYQHI